MATYYIAASGNDTTGAGTIGSPWATLTKAATVAVQGDTVNVNRGDTINDTNPTFAVGVTIQPYGTGANPTVALGTSHLVFNDAPGITLTNVNFTNSSTTYTSGPSTEIVRINRTITGSRLSGITVTGCSFSGGQNGFRIYTSTTDASGYNNISITGCTFYNCSLTGLYIHGAGTSGTTYHYSAVTVSNNVAYNITGSSVNGYGWGLNIAAADTSVGANAVSGNLVYSCGASSVPSGGSGVGIQMLGTNGCTVTGNVCHDISCGASSAGDGSGIDIDVGNDNVLVEYNVTFNCGGAGMIGFSNSGHAGNVFRFNLSVNDALTKNGSITFSLSTDGEGAYTFYNNTCISLAGQPCVYNASATTLYNKKLYNNLFYCLSGPIVNVEDNGTGTAYDHNCYIQPSFSATYNSTNYTSLAAWKTATGNDASSLYSATSPFVGPIGSGSIPAFVPGSFSLDTPYSLTSGSTPQGAGANLQSLYSINAGSQDLNGNAIGTSGYSIGAISPADVAISPRLGSGAALMTCF